MTIAQQYHDACRKPSDIYEHLPVFVKTAQELDAQKVVELGSRGGVSTVAWLYAMEETDGHLWSVDLGNGPTALSHDRWTFIEGNDLDPKVVRQLPDDADIVFIDTIHTYEQTLAELNVYVHKVRPGGRILLHDSAVHAWIGMRGQPPFPVKTAVEEFCADEGLAATYRDNCFGLATIQIPE